MALYFTMFKVSDTVMRVVVVFNLVYNPVEDSLSKFFCVVTVGNKFAHSKTGFVTAVV